MPRLSHQQLQERLRMDYKVAWGMRIPLMNVTAYRNADDLRERRNPITSIDEGHLAKHYLANYFIRTLIGPDRYSDKTSIHFDLFANGNYPFTEPSCWVIDSAMPWSPVFKSGLPVATLFSEWHEADGDILFGHLLVRVAMLLNFDGIPRLSDYGGWNPEAAQYWRDYLGMQPITPNLPYPVLPKAITSPLIGRLRRRHRFRHSLQVFLCHSHGDKLKARNLYDNLRAEGLDPWLDEEKILPGEDWRRKVIKAVRNSHAVIICLSKDSINKTGFVQNEIKQALDVAEEQPEGTIFLIPLKLEECEIPERLSRWHCVSLVDPKGYERLLGALLMRANTLENE